MIISKCDKAGQVGQVFYEFVNYINRVIDVYKPDTIVRLKKTGQFARIVEAQFAYDRKTLMHYLAEIEGREGHYVVYHYDVDLECLPVTLKLP